jgi:hypothetical protein
MYTSLPMRHSNKINFNHFNKDQIRLKTTLLDFETARSHSRTRSSVPLVSSVSVLCTAVSGLLSDRCPLFMLYCWGHQCGMSCVCRDNHLLNGCIDIYSGRTEYTDKLEELRVAGWQLITTLLLVIIITLYPHSKYFYRYIFLYNLESDLIENMSLSVQL